MRRHARRPPSNLRVRDKQWVAFELDITLGQNDVVEGLLFDMLDVTFDAVASVNNVTLLAMVIGFNLYGTIQDYTIPYAIVMDGGVTPFMDAAPWSTSFQLYHDILHLGMFRSHTDSLSTTQVDPLVNEGMLQLKVKRKMDETKYCRIYFGSTQKASSGIVTVWGRALLLRP